MKSTVVSILVLTLTASCCCRESLVPLLALSNCPSLPSTPISHGDVDTVLTQVDIQEFSIAIVMKAEKLSFDDIAKYGGVYGEKNAALSNLQDFLSSSVSSFSAGVSGEPASELTSSLSFAMDTTPITVKGEDVSQISKLEGDGPHLVVVELSGGNDEDTFRAHDMLLAEVKALLDHSSVKYAIFYTSDHSSTKRHPQKRSTAQQYTKYTQNTGSPLCYEVKDEYNYTSCIVFCFTSRNILYVTENTTILLGNGENGIMYERGSCNSTDSLPEEFQTNTTFAFIMFRVEGNASADGEKPIRKSLVFTFENGTCNQKGSENNGVGCGFWTMKLHAGDKPHEVTEYRRNRPDKNIFTKFSIPQSASYSCGNCSLNTFVSASTAESNDSYQLGGIHVQAFSRVKLNEDNQFVFGSAYQCQGYIDMPSMMGVISVLVLLLLLYVSYVAAFSLQSLDTFDDPRSPTVSVENLH